MKYYKWHKSELFPGAWVVESRRDKKVDVVFTFRVELAGEGSEKYYFKDLFPVPITPVRLETAGFENINGVWAFHGADLYEVFHDEEHGWIYRYSRCQVSYFHELQARIFWDSGKEILLTLEK